MPLTLNANAAPPGPYPARLRRILDRAAVAQARSEISTWPGYQPTPLRSAHSLASRLRLKSVWVKDESGRFGLGSFKALGGALGIRHAMKSQGIAPAAPAGAPPPPGATTSPHPRDGSDPSPFTVVCASDGNHGRSVAWGARMFGCRAVVYLPAHVTEARAAAIRSLGARVARIPGEYDDALAQAARDARRNDWTIVSDTSAIGGADIPQAIMAGYAVMVDEAVAARDGPGRPTHIFVQGGVGGLAAAAIGHLWERFGTRRPTAAIVEPAAADCLYQSALHGRPAPSRGTLTTIMAGLSCREVSPLAWQILRAGAQAFATATDDGIAPLMRAAASGDLGDPFEGGESGVAGLLGLIGAAEDPAQRAALGLDERSRVLVFNTEGATDPELYARIVGGRASAPSSSAIPTCSAAPGPFLPQFLARRTGRPPL